MSKFSHLQWLSSVPDINLLLLKFFCSFLNWRDVLLVFKTRDSICLEVRLACWTVLWKVNYVRSLAKLKGIQMRDALWDHHISLYKSLHHPNAYFHPPHLTFSYSFLLPQAIQKPKSCNVSQFFQNSKLHLKFSHAALSLKQPSTPCKSRLISF